MFNTPAGKGAKPEEFLVGAVSTLAEGSDARGVVAAERQHDAELRRS
jgi:hypothetical protein